MRALLTYVIIETKKILFVINDIRLEATLLVNKTANAIYDLLPIEGHAQLWGDEIYFNIPIQLDIEPDAKEEVEKGDLAFWPIGSAFCIFFGRTPVSIGHKPRAYSPVNVFGKIEGDLKILKTVKSNSLVRVEKVIK